MTDEKMKVFVVIEDFDSGPGYASYNICDIFSTEKQAIEEMNRLIEEYEDVCGVKMEDMQTWEQCSYRVLDWDVK